KLDVHALPTPDFRGETAVIIPSSTYTETALVAIWSDVLQTNQFGIGDNFFALGGHSLLGTQIISRIRHQLGVDLPLQTIFTAPTIAALAQQVETAVQTTERPLETHPLQADYPLSFAQQRLWFLHQLERDNTGYTIGTAVSLRGLLNINALTQSVNAIVSRHESLRTQFIMVEDQPRQQVQPAIPFTIPVEDVLENTDLTNLIDTHQRQPFDLNDNLVRFKLLRLAADHHILLLNMHHIIADGWSATVLTRELSAAYAEFSAGRTWKPTPLPIQYRDFSQWQRQWLSGDVLEQQMAYWHEQLRGNLPIIELPADAPRPTQQTFAGAKQVAAVSPQTNRALRRLSNTHHTTLFMTMLAGFKLLVHRLTAQTDIVIGSPIANRNRQEIESLIGFFANTLVLRTRFAPADNFTDLLHLVRETTLGAYAHQDVPFEQLVEQFQPERDLSRPPLFQLFFNMINIAKYGKFALPDLETTAVENGRILSKFDLTLYVIDDDTNLRLEIVYNRDLYSLVRMTTLLDQYVALLDQIVQAPERPLADFSLTAVSPALPNPAQPLPAQWHTPAHHLLTRQAEQHPTRVAIIDPTQSWTSAQLETRSNQLAHYLLAQGIQKGNVVAIGAQRQAELVVAIVAVHKAGAAFAILDLAYPPLRLIDQLKQAKPDAWLQIGNEITPELDSYLIQQSFKLHAKFASLPFADYPTTPPEITVMPHDLATISFTSGTAGKPQAICGTHLSLAHFWHWHT
ncbi:MAG: AMP-binding protein, partial [Chloroflexi bacterium]|nr:AMP-binding protein [Chloroflexota bacterium]